MVVVTEIAFTFEKLLGVIIEKVLVESSTEGRVVQCDTKEVAGVHVEHCHLLAVRSDWELRLVVELIEFPVWIFLGEIKFNVLELSLEVAIVITPDRVDGQLLDVFLVEQAHQLIKLLLLRFMARMRIQIITGSDKEVKVLLRIGLSLTLHIVDCLKDLAGPFKFIADVAKVSNNYEARTMLWILVALNVDSLECL